MKSERPYIFVIGFNRCGTNTIHGFFQRNGYPSVHYGWYGKCLAVQMVKNCISNKKVFEGFDIDFTVFSDLNFINNRICIEGNFLFRNMDRDYPDSFFIYNTRDIEKWIKSRLAYVNPNGIRLLDRYKKIYQTDNIDLIVGKWKELRGRFEQDLQEYFSGSDRLLVLNIESKDPAIQISNFLQKDLDPGAWGWLGKTIECNE